MTGRCLDPKCLDGPRDEDNEPLPRWTAEGSCLCTRCRDLLERRLADLPSLVAQLDHLLLHGLPAGRSLGNGRTKGEPPLPSRGFAEVHDHLADVQQKLASWVQMTCEERQLRGPDRSDVRTLTFWLLSQFDWLARHLAAGDLADEVRDLHRTAEGIAQTQPQRHHLPVPCPDEKCGAHEMSRLDGADHVICLACGLTWHESDYARLVLVLATDRGTSVTAKEGAERAGVRPEVFRQWVSRGKVRRLGTVNGAARYSTADVDALTKETA